MAYYQQLNFNIIILLFQYHRIHRYYFNTILSQVEVDQAVDGQLPFLSCTAVQYPERVRAWARGLESALEKWTKSDET